MAALIFLALSAVMFVIAWHVFVIGVRIGDRLGDATVGSAEADHGSRGISFAVRNPGPQPVLIGASVRRRSVRLRAGGVQLVTAPRRTLRDNLLASQHAVVCAIPAGTTETLVVPLPDSVRRAELVVAIGQPDRLRVIRCAIELNRRRVGERRLARYGPPLTPTRR